MSKIVTFGKVMIRLQPYNYERFVQAEHLLMETEALRTTQKAYGT